MLRSACSRRSRARLARERPSVGTKAGRGSGVGGRVGLTREGATRLPVALSRGLGCREPPGSAKGALPFFGRPYYCVAPAELAMSKSPVSIVKEKFGDK